MYAARNYFHTIQGITILPETSTPIVSEEVDYLLESEICEDWEDEGDEYTSHQ